MASARPCGASVSWACWPGTGGRHPECPCAAQPKGRLGDIDAEDPPPPLEALQELHPYMEDARSGRSPWPC